VDGKKLQKELHSLRNSNRRNKSKRKRKKKTKMRVLAMRATLKMLRKL